MKQTLQIEARGGPRKIPHLVKSTSDLDGQYGKKLLMFDLVVWRLTPLDKTAQLILNKNKILELTARKQETKRFPVLFSFCFCKKTEY